MRFYFTTQLRETRATSFGSGTGSCLLWGSVALLAGCATVAPPDYSDDVRYCADHLANEAWAGQDPADNRAFYRPDSQPWFVISRFHASFNPANLSDAAFSEWKIKVIDHSWQELEASQQQLMGRAMSASRACLVELAFATPASDWQTYAETARDYDLYRDWQRWAGVYPISSLVVSQRIRSAQAEWLEDYGGPFDQDVQRYRPTTDQEPLPIHQERMADWLAEGYAQSALSLPQLTSEQLNALFAHHAPELHVLQDSDADRLGSVGTSMGEPEFRTEPAVAYVQPMMTRFQGDYLLQLSYTYWFRERPRTSRFDIYGGPWNGVTWRVTLDTEGEPLWFDVMHNCGCYHQVWLSENHQPSDNIGRESPLFLPYDWTGRPRLTLTSGEHYVRNVEGVARDEQANTGLDAAGTAAQPYQIRPYRSLLTLESETLESADGNGSTVVSLFDQRGLIPASRRAERYVLWPFGVKSPGAMRRLGTHTIAFVGKRHFDDPALFEQLIQPVEQQ